MCFACMCVCVPQTCMVPMEAWEGTRYPGPVVTDSWVTMWELNPVPLKEQTVLLIAKQSL